MEYVLQIVRQESRGKANPYLKLAAATAQNGAISFAARGLLAYLLSRRNGWKLTDAELKAQGIGRDAYYTLLRELMAAGYIQQPKARQQGRFVKQPLQVRECLTVPFEDSDSPEQEGGQPVTDEAPAPAAPVVGEQDAAGTASGSTVSGKAVHGETGSGRTVSGSADQIHIIKSSSQITEEKSQNHSSKPPAAGAMRPEHNQGAGDDDDALQQAVFQGWFRDYASRHGLMPPALEPVLLENAQRLGESATRAVMGRGEPSSNPWGYLLAKLMREPTPEPPCPTGGEERDQAGIGSRHSITGNYYALFDR